ncbi:MAG: PAS domain S-box protein [Spirochaetes bacterium]|nr:PAS domain S-box protein [Spirochaetota bacterium]
MAQRHKPASAAKETFEYILENIPDGTVLINAETKKITICNTLMRRMLGCAKKDLLNKSICSINPEESRPYMEELYAHLPENGNELLKDIPVRRKDGSLFYADISASVIEYNGKPYLLAVFRDITGRREAEDKLKKNEELFRTLFTSINEGFYVSEVIRDHSGNPCDYTYLEVNPRFEQIAGMPRDRIIGKRYRELVPADTTQWLDTYFKVAQTGEPATYEFYSAEYEMYFMTYAYRLAGDQVAVLVLDITESRKMERELADARLLLDTAIMQSPVPMVIVSCPDAVIRIVNSACREYLGIQDGESYIGRPLPELKPTWTDYDEHGNRISLSEMPLALAMQGIETRNKEYYTRRKDGSVRWNTVSACPVRNSNGEIIAAYLVFPDITERKLAEEELKKNEGMLQSILKAAQVGIALLKNRVFIKVNPALCRITGYTEEDMTGGYTRILYPDDEEFNRIGTELYGKMQTDGVGRSEARLKRKDGTLIYVILGLSPFDPKDLSAGVTATVQDITDRKLAEQALSESEDRFRRIMEESPISIQILSPQGELVDMNKASENLWGVSRESVKKYNIFRDKQLEKQGIMPFVRRAFSGEKITTPEVEYNAGILDGTGRMRIVQGTFYPIRDANEGIRYIVLMHMDMTGRRLAEESVKKNESVLKSLFDATPIGISLLVNRAAVKVNSAMCRILGYSEEELIGRDARTLYADEAEYNRVGKELYGQMEKEGIGQIESRYRRKDGTIIDVLLYMSPFVPGDQSAGVALAVLDITEAKKSEAEKLRMEEMLIRAQKMEAIGTMAGGIAHDFNNILSGIFGFSELCLTVEGNPPKTEYYIREVIKAADRAKDIINRILTFSRRSEHELRPITPKYIIKELAKLLRASTPAEIELKVRMDSDSAVMAEPALIHQVVLNLCSNSIHAMQSKPGVIEITLEDMEADAEFARLHPGLNPGKHILLRVSDTGCGITPDIQEFIFDPFFTTKPPGEGTGLGLSVVHGIIKKLNGSIKVYSEHGKGTAVNIIIPAVKNKAVETDSPGSIIKGKGERILLLDDEDSIVQSLGSILKNLGYKVEAFTDSREALDDFRNNPGNYDIIITDYSMPHMTGLELVRKIKEAKKDIPIILESGYIDQSLEESALQEGISILLTKPASTYQIADAVRRALSGAGSDA